MNTVNLTLCCNCFEVLTSLTPVFMMFPLLQNVMPVTIAAASGQVKTVLDVIGWQSGERGWRAKTWRNKKTREVGPSAAHRRNSKTKE